jgi:hypothetical protein
MCVCLQAKREKGKGDTLGTVFAKLTRLRQLAVHPDLPKYRERRALERPGAKQLKKADVGRLIKALKQVKETTACSRCEEVRGFAHFRAAAHSWSCSCEFRVLTRALCADVDA